ncbi:hypothetical protein [Allosphingosinicella humi]
MSDELEEITLEEILDDIIDAQIQIIDAVSKGKPMANGEDLIARLQELQEILRGADEDA